MLGKCCLRVSVTETSHLSGITVFISENEGRPGQCKPGRLLAVPFHLPLFYLQTGWFKQLAFLQCFSLHGAHVSTIRSAQTVFARKRWQKPDVFAAPFRNAARILAEGWLLNGGVRESCDVTCHPARFVALSWQTEFTDGVWTYGEPFRKRDFCFWFNATW